MRTRYVVLGAIALFASLVFADSWAGNHGQPPPAVGTNPAPQATAGALAGAVSGSVSNAAGGSARSTGIGVGGNSSASVSGINATGGTASAAGGNGYGGMGGEGGSSSADSSAHADGSSRNALVNSTNVERSVGALIMGTVIPVDCGFGGQAGGSNRNGAGFLGASWTTDKCYTLKVANAWAAMGEYELACEMLVDVSKKALKRRHRQPDCVVIGASLRAAHAQPDPVVINRESLVPSGVSFAQGALTFDEGPKYVSPSEMREYVDRAFRKAVGK